MSELRAIQLKSGYKIYYKRYSDHVKCGSCNWEYKLLLSFNPKTIDSDGLCAECFLIMLFESADAVLQSEPVEVDES